MPETNVHPVMPTYDEVKQDPAKLFSDHIPVLFAQDIAGIEIKFLSWNVLGPNAYSGMHTTTDWETDPGVQLARINRNAGAIQRMVECNQPDVIVLQEADPRLMQALLKTELFKNWHTHDSGRGVMMLISHKFNLRGQIQDHLNEKHHGVFMQSRQLAQLQLGKVKVDLHNVHTQFQHTPEHHESYYRQLMNDAPLDTTVVILGDTNARIAPDNKLNHVITTGIIPMRFNEDNNPEHATRPFMQLTDFPDGAFIKKPKINIMQIPRIVLDPNTGRIVAPVPADQPHCNEFRMLLCLEDNPKPLADLEMKIADLFADKQILVRPAAKDNNVRGVGLRFAPQSPVFTYLLGVFEKLLGKDPKWCHPKRLENAAGLTCPTLFVHEDKFQFLVDLLEPAFITLQEIRKEIERLKLLKSRLFAWSPEDKITALTKLQSDIQMDFAKKPLLTIIEDWQNSMMTTANSESRAVKSILADQRSIFSIFSKPDSSLSQTWVAQLTKTASSCNTKEDESSASCSSSSSSATSSSGNNPKK